jgi:hypothetical protein
MEASFLTNLGLAITCLEQGSLFPPLAFAGFPADTIEARRSETMERMLVTGWGHYRGEGTALIERIT